MPDFIEIIIQARDLASDKIDKIADELARLQKESGGADGNLSKLGTTLGRQQGQIKGFADQLARGVSNSSALRDSISNVEREIKRLGDSNGFDRITAGSADARASTINLEQDVRRLSQAYGQLAQNAASLRTALDQGASLQDLERRSQFLNAATPQNQALARRAGAVPFTASERQAQRARGERIDTPASVRRDQDALLSAQLTREALSALTQAQRGERGKLPEFFSPTTRAQVQRLADAQRQSGAVPFSTGELRARGDPNLGQILASIERDARLFAGNEQRALPPPRLALPSGTVGSVPREEVPRRGEPIPLGPIGTTPRTLRSSGRTFVQGPPERIALPPGRVFELGPGPQQQAPEPAIRSERLQGAADKLAKVIEGLGERVRIAGDFTPKQIANFGKSVDKANQGIEATLAGQRRRIGVAGPQISGAESTLRGLITDGAITGDRAKIDEVSSSLKGLGEELNKVGGNAAMRTLGSQLKDVAADLARVKTPQDLEKTLDDFDVLNDKLHLSKSALGDFRNSFEGALQGVRDLTQGMAGLDSKSDEFKSKQSEATAILTGLRTEARRFGSDGAFLADTLGNLAKRTLEFGDASSQTGKEAQKAEGPFSAFSNGISGIVDWISTLIPRFGAFLPLLPLFGVLLGDAVVGVGGLVGGITALASALSSLAGLLVVLPQGLIALGGAFIALKGIIGGDLGLGGVFSAFSALDKAGATINAKGQVVDPGTRTVAQGNAQKSNALQLQSLRNTIQQQELQGTQAIIDAERRLGQVRFDNHIQELDAASSLRDTRLRVTNEILDAETRLAALRAQNNQTLLGLEQELGKARFDVSQARARGGEGLSIAIGEEANAQTQIANFKASPQFRQQAIDERHLKVLKTTGNDEIARQERDFAKLKHDDHLQELTAISALTRAEQSLAFNRKQDQIQLKQNALQAQNAAASGTTAVQKALAELDPIQKKILFVFQTLNKQFDKFAQPLADVFNTAFLGLVKAADKHFPSFAKIEAKYVGGFTSLVGGITGLINEGPQKVGGKGKAGKGTVPSFSKEFFSAFDTGAGAVSKVLRAFVPFLDALIRFTNAGKPLINFLSGLVLHFGKWLDHITKVGEKSGALHSFFKGTITVVKELGGIFKNLGTIFIDIIKAGFKPGVGLLDGFEKLTGHVAKFFNSAKGKAELADFFKRAIPVFKELLSIIPAFGKAFFKIFDALTTPGKNQSGTPFDALIKVINGPLLNTLSNLIIAFAKSGGAEVTNILGLAIVLLNTFSLLAPSLTLFFNALNPILKLINLIIEGIGKLPKPVQGFLGQFLVASTGFLLLKKFFPEIAKFLEGFAKHVVALPKLITPIVEGFGKVGGVIKGLPGLLARLPAAIPGALAKLKEFANLRVAIAIVGVAALVALLGHFRVLHGLTKKIGDAFGDLNKKLGGVLTPLAQIAGVVAALVGPKALFGLLRSGIGFLVGALADAGAALAGFFGVADVGFAGLTIAAGPWILAIGAVIALAILVATHWKQTLAILKDVWHGIVSGFDFVKKTVEGFVNTVIDFVEKHWKLIVEILLAVFLGPVGLIAAFALNFGKIKDVVTGWWKDVVRFFTDTIPQSLGQILGGLGKVWNGIKKSGAAVFTDVLKAIKTSWQDVVSFFTKDIPKIGDTLLNAVKGIFTKIVNAVKGIPGINLLIKGIGFISGIFGGDNKIKPIPPHGRADGGMIDAVPGGVYRVAEAGHPEMVIPLDPKKRQRAWQLMKQTGHMLKGGDSWWENDQTYGSGGMWNWMGDFQDGGVVSPTRGGPSPGAKAAIDHYRHNRGGFLHALNHLLQLRRGGGTLTGELGKAGRTLAGSPQQLYQGATVLADLINKTIVQGDVGVATGDNAKIARANDVFGQIAKAQIPRTPGQVAAALISLLDPELRLLKLPAASRYGEFLGGIRGGSRAIGIIGGPPVLDWRPPPVGGTFPHMAPGAKGQLVETVLKKIGYRSLHTGKRGDSDTGALDVAYGNIGFESRARFADSSEYKIGLRREGVGGLLDKERFARDRKLIPAGMIPVVGEDGITWVYTKAPLDSSRLRRGGGWQYNGQIYVPLPGTRRPRGWRDEIGFPGLGVVGKEVNRYGDRSVGRQTVGLGANAREVVLYEAPDGRHYYIERRAGAPDGYARVYSGRRRDQKRLTPEQQRERDRARELKRGSGRAKHGASTAARSEADRVALGNEFEMAVEKLTQLGMDRAMALKIAQDPAVVANFLHDESIGRFRGREFYRDDKGVYAKEGKQQVYLPGVRTEAEFRAYLDREKAKDEQALGDLGLGLVGQRRVESFLQKRKVKQMASVFGDINRAAGGVRPKPPRTFKTTTRGGLGGGLSAFQTAREFRVPTDAEIRADSYKQFAAVLIDPKDYERTFVGPPGSYHAQLMTALERQGIDHRELGNWLQGRFMFEHGDIARLNLYFEENKGHELLRAQAELAARNVYGLPTLLARARVRRAHAAGYDTGGPVVGDFPNQPVPITAHVGEWVLTPQQQAKAAQLAGKTRRQLEDSLFNRTDVTSAAGASVLGGGSALFDPTGSLARILASPRGQGTQVHQNMTVNTTQAEVDAAYMARVLEVHASGAFD